MRRQPIGGGEPDDLFRPRVEPEITPHDAYAMIAMAGKIVEGGMHLSKETLGDELQLDLLHRPAVELLGDFDFPPALLRRRDDCVGLVQAVGDGSLQQHMQPMLDRHQADLAVGAPLHADDSDGRCCLANQPIDIGERRHAKLEAKGIGCLFSTAPDRDKLQVVRKRRHEGPIHVPRSSASSDETPPGPVLL